MTLGILPASIAVTGRYNVFAGAQRIFCCEFERLLYPIVESRLPVLLQQAGL